MDNINKIYRCSICGAIVERTNNIESKLTCCGKEMILEKGKENDSKIEKHVPFVEKISNDKVKIQIGENEKHPMTNEHYIEFIEVITNNNKLLRKNLTAKDEPSVIFDIPIEEIKEVREYCNLHGLWIKKL